jgi:hypothetical protein
MPSNALGKWYSWLPEILSPPGARGLTAMEVVSKVRARAGQEISYSTIFSYLKKHAAKSDAGFEMIKGRYRRTGTAVAAQLLRPSAQASEKG